jgi:hypothetical protein
MTLIAMIFAGLTRVDPPDPRHPRSKTFVPVIVFFQKEITFASLNLAP